LKIVISAIVILATLGLLSATGAYVGRGFLRRNDTGTVVRVEPSVRGDLVEFVSASGEVEPRTKVSISSRVVARINELPFDEGHSVKKGDVLVRFDDKELKAALDSVEARYAAQESEITVAQTRITVQQAQIDVTRVDYEDAQRDLRRQTQLLATKDVSQSTVDTAQSKVDGLKARLMAARQTLAADEAGLIVMRHNLDAARAEIARASDNVSYATIASPIDGTVTKREAEVGELAVMGTMNNAGTVLMEVADLSKMWLVARVDESSITAVKVGQKAKIRMQAFGDEVFDGVVEKVALAFTEERLTNTKFFEAKILLDTKGKMVPSGLNGDAEIETNRLESVLKVPTQSVVGRPVENLPPDLRNKPEVDKRKTIATVVYRFVDGKAAVTPVTVGPSDVTHTVIKSGLGEGDRVVTGPYKVLESIQNDDRIRDEAGVQAAAATQPAKK
jgi:HlyD family secretion protein